MRKSIDLTGTKIGILTVLSRAGKYNNGQSKWKCLCECGNHTVVAMSSLRDGTTKSCGCWKKYAAVTHGRSGDSTYNSWRGMLARCKNKNNEKFHRYGSRGITVCERWLQFENFLVDMGERPPDTTLDRKENNGNYEPGNCRWATPKEQALNRKSNRIVEFLGIRLAVSVWAERLGISRKALTSRLNRGWSPAKALLTPALFG